jgi:hypothetical protein
VKAKYGLKDKSQAISLILKRYKKWDMNLNLDRNLSKTQTKHRKFVEVKDFEEESNTE